MNGAEPFLLLRARIRSESRERFDAWFRDVHVPDALRIPGMVSVRSAHTPAGTLLAFYGFASAEQVPTALQSPEAAYARGTWERWSDELDELRVEMFSVLGLMPVYHTIN